MSDKDSDGTKPSSQCPIVHNLIEIPLEDKSILDDLAFALTNHDGWDTSISATYIDLT